MKFGYAKVSTQGQKLESQLTALKAEPWADSTSPTDKMMLTVMAGLAEFERDLINERTSEGRTRAMKWC